jgi:hypothetical protein
VLYHSSSLKYVFVERQRLAAEKKRRSFRKQRLFTPAILSFVLTGTSIFGQAKAGMAKKRRSRYSPR